MFYFSFINFFVPLQRNSKRPERKKRQKNWYTSIFYTQKLFKTQLGFFSLGLDDLHRGCRICNPLPRKNPKQCKLRKWHFPLLPALKNPNKIQSSHILLQSKCLSITPIEIHDDTPLSNCGSDHGFLRINLFEVLHNLYLFFF